MPLRVAILGEGVSQSVGGYEEPECNRSGNGHIAESSKWGLNSVTAGDVQACKESIEVLPEQHCRNGRYYPKEHASGGS